MQLHNTKIVYPTHKKYSSALISPFSLVEVANFKSSQFHSTMRRQLYSLKHAVIINWLAEKKSSQYNL